MASTTPPLGRAPSESLNYDPNNPQSPASPDSRAYLTIVDTAFPCAWYDYTVPALAVGTDRPKIQALIATKRDDDMKLLKNWLRNGTVALLTETGKTITAYGANLDSYKSFDKLPGWKQDPGGKSFAAVVISCDPINYRAS